jgi:hypothetical protein
MTKVGFDKGGSCRYIKHVSQPDALADHPSPMEIVHLIQLGIKQDRRSRQLTKFSSNNLRVKPDLLKPFNLISSVQSCSEKFSALPVGQIISTSPRHPASQEGRLAIVMDAGRDAVDACGADDDCAASGRRSRVVPISRR